MAKSFYTTAKNGDTVEVDHELAKSLIASGKKNPEDFMISETVDEGTTVQGGIVFMHPTTQEKATKYVQRDLGIEDGSSSMLDEYFRGIASGEGNPRAPEFIKDNPGTILALGASPFLPLSGLGALGAGIVGAGSEALNKLVQDDYKGNKPIDNVTDILGAGAGSSLAHGLITLAHKSILAPYLKVKADNVKATEDAVTANEKIALENAAKAKFIANAKYESIDDPESLLRFYKSKMMEESQDVTKTFIKDIPQSSKNTNQAINQYLTDSERFALDQENLKRLQNGLPQINPLVSSDELAKGIVEPSAWDVAKYKNVMETPTPNVVADIQPMPTANFLEYQPNLFKLEDKISNIFRGGNAGNPAWYSLRNNTALYPMVDNVLPLTSGFADATGSFVGGNRDDIRKKISSTAGEARGAVVKSGSNMLINGMRH